MVKDNAWNGNADFSYFVLHDPDEFDTPKLSQEPKAFDVVNGIENNKAIINSIISFWGNEKYMREYFEQAKLNKSDRTVVRFHPSEIEDLAFLQEFHTRVHGGGYQHALSLETKKSIKDFPHIYKGLMDNWWKPKDFHEFLKLSRLTVQDRDRWWFAPSVIFELQALIDEHNKRFWLPKKEENDFEVHKDNWNIDNKTR